MPNLTLQKIQCLEKTGKCPKPSYPKSKVGFPFSGNTNIPGSSLSKAMLFSAKVNAKHTGRGQIKYVGNIKNQYGYYSNNGKGGYGEPPRNKF